MDQIQFDQITQFLRLQKQIMESYDSYLSAAARRIGLTKPEADILLFLANNPQFHTARDVVALRGFSKTYVSKAVDLLAGRGLLETETSAADRRMQVLRLTKSAVQPARILQRAQSAYFQALGSGITSEEAAVLLRLVQHIQDHLRQIRPIP